ncbi:late sexual development protein [Tothia fuscella]|uniref:Late sexual development protein n=1 Tax=Tothia fuscella TaxID=1048955 RepID=A0A9P4NR56_9PEZI|nr:late sexual development protein [Tothia fuscella]
MPNNQQLQKIEELAHGTLPNGPPPPPGAISAEGITNLQLVEFNENFEVAFFSSLLFNVTTNVSGFEISDSKQRDFVIEVLTAVLAQEELHAINAEQGLQSQNQQPILPCKYVFPTTTFDDAIVLAATFTDLVLGTLQDVIEVFADNNDNAATRGVASVIGQEGEQEGFYRLLQNKKLIPNALPFLTTSVRDFAFSALQGFVVPGSCPNEDLINLKIFGILNLNTKVIQPKDQDLSFSFDINSLKQSKNLDFKALFGSSSGPDDYSKYDYTKLSLVLINQQNLPIVEPLKNVQVKGSVVSFDALFPFEENSLNSLTIAAVTVGKGPFASARDVADATLFAPALIEVN